MHLLVGELAVTDIQPALLVVQHQLEMVAV
jgi:hypothetical protein